MFPRFGITKYALPFHQDDYWLGFPSHFLFSDGHRTGPRVPAPFQLKWVANCISACRGNQYIGLIDSALPLKLQSCCLKCNQSLCPKSIPCLPPENCRSFFSTLGLSSCQLHNGFSQVRRRGNPSSYWKSQLRNRVRGNYPTVSKPNTQFHGGSYQHPPGSWGMVPEGEWVAAYKQRVLWKTPSLI